MVFIMCHAKYAAIIAAVCVPAVINASSHGLSSFASCVGEASMSGTFAANVVLVIKFLILLDWDAVYMAMIVPIAPIIDMIAMTPRESNGANQLLTLLSSLSLSLLVR